MMRVASAIACLLFSAALAEASAQTKEGTMALTVPIETVLREAAPLKHPRGKRLPIYLWPAMNPGKLTDAQALDLVRELDRRGVGLVSRWDHGRFGGTLSDALPVARAQKKLGLPINIDATTCMYSFFNGDESTAHVDDAGKPFWDPSFGKADMGCPFAVEHRRAEIRGRIERFADAYKREGLSAGFVFADWEVDGPIAWNGAWEASKRCKRCRERIPEIGNFLAFQKALYDLRADMQRDVYAEPLLRRFPSVLVGNYGVYPHDGFRYWYDYFEREEDWYPGIRDRKTLYRHWPDEFTGTGYTFAMPVVYTWSRMWNWYDFDNADYRWFRPMLLAATNAGRHTPANVPVIAFVHWHTTDPPKPPDPAIKQMSAWAYQELLWHMLLRGVDTFFLWCPQEENAEEVRLLHPVWAAAQEYGEFLERGEHVCFDVPDSPGTVISGLLLGDRVLVRRTDFVENEKEVTLRVSGQDVRIPAGKRCWVMDVQATGRVSPERRP